FVKSADRGPAVADEREPDGTAALHLVGEAHPGEDGERRPEHRARRIDPFLRDGKMEDAVAAARGRRRAPHVLREELPRADAAHERRAEVADQRDQEIAVLERGGGADRGRLLSERAVEAADDLSLPV